MTNITHHISQFFNQQVSIDSFEALPWLADNPTNFVHNPTDFVFIPLNNIPSPTNQTISPNTSDDGIVKCSKDSCINIEWLPTKMGDWRDGWMNKKSVLIARKWFTDPQMFFILQQKFKKRLKYMFFQPVRGEVRFINSMVNTVHLRCRCTVQVFALHVGSVKIKPNCDFAGNCDFLVGDLFNLLSKSYVFGQRVRNLSY